MLAMTGATGFIGSYLANHLPFNLRMLTRAERQAALGKEIIFGDLSDLSKIKLLVKEASCLLHLACSSNPRKSEGNLAADLEENLLPTIKLFEEYARSNPRGHILFASTGGNMYADQDNLLKTEQDLPCPRSGYSVHKLAAEHYLRLIAESYGIKATVLRISNPYGTIFHQERIQGLIGVAFAKLLNNEPLTIFDAEDTRRDYIHLSDLCHCISMLIEKTSSHKGYEVFNVSSGIGYSISDVLATIEEVTGLKFTIKYLPDALSKTPSLSVLSYERLKQRFGWKPKMTLRKGIEEMWHEFAKCEVGCSL